MLNVPWARLSNRTRAALPAEAAGATITGVLAHDGTPTATVTGAPNGSTIPFATAATTISMTRAREAAAADDGSATATTTTMQRVRRHIKLQRWLQLHAQHRGGTQQLMLAPLSGGGPADGCKVDEDCENGAVCTRGRKGPFQCQWNSKTDWGIAGSTCEQDTDCNIGLLCAPYMRFDGVCQKPHPIYSRGGPALVVLA